ncbi:hypothetical protein JZO86_10800 [Enterococcus ureasiticus]|uniref:hypothetical protein n=1 Tax=Enterococcus ureasiticus TaxID=903984 RepID=UPI001A8D93BC|nr:hypothetical protein [Enterococcus ureasiticus]MBO0474187.1 hypothetical protein [Enterococcus ureasiticus]
MELFKEFKREQENAQVELNSNFVEIEKGVSERVQKTGNETIAGTKNFTGNLQVAGKNVLTEIDTNPLWSGAWMMNAVQTVTPKKKITDCQTGWILVFQGWDSASSSSSDSVFHFFHIPKTQAIHFSGKGINLQISDWKGANRGIKYVYVSDTQVKGHEMNGTAPNNTLVMTRVFEY